MARIIEHVRFKLSDLIKAVQAIQQLDQTPSVQEALTFYWNWAQKRQWKLLAVSNQMDPNTTVLNIENSPQLEIRNEEFWNVIWIAEEVVTSSPDLIKEVPPAVIDRKFQRVLMELKDRGWIITTSDFFERDDFEALPIRVIQDAIEPDLDVKTIVDELEHSRRII